MDPQTLICFYALLLPLNFCLCLFSTCDLADSLRFCFDFLLLFISCFRIITYFHNHQQFGQLEPLSFLGLPWAFSICFTILSWAENSIPQNLQIVPEITISFFLLKKFIILNDKLFTIKCYGMSILFRWVWRVWRLVNTSIIYKVLT